MAKALGKVLLILGLILFIISWFLEWLPGFTGLDYSQLNGLGDYFGNFLDSLTNCGNFWCYLRVLSPIFILIGIVFAIVGIFSRLGVIGGIFLLLAMIGFLGSTLTGGTEISALAIGAWIGVIGVFLAFIGGIAAAGEDDNY